MRHLREMLPISFAHTVRASSPLVSHAAVLQFLRSHCCPLVPEVEQLLSKYAEQIDRVSDTDALLVRRGFALAYGFPRKLCSCAYRQQRL